MRTMRNVTGAGVLIAAALSETSSILADSPSCESMGLSCPGEFYSPTPQQCCTNSGIVWSMMMCGLEGPLEACYWESDPPGGCGAPCPS